jgi:hypothetical protein
MRKLASRRTGLIGGTGALFFFGLQVALQSTALSLLPQTVVVTEDSGAGWSPRVIQALSAGRVSAVSDGLLIRTLTDDRTHWVPKGRHPRIYQDLDLATRVDPWEPSTYLLAGRLLSVVRNDALGAREILLRGEAFRKERAPLLPESALKSEWQSFWPLLMALFYIESFELQEWDHARERVKELVSVRGHPRWFELFAQKLDAPGHLSRLGLRVLDSLLEGAISPRERRELEEKKRQLQERLRSETKASP